MGIKIGSNTNNTMHIGSSISFNVSDKNNLNQNTAARHTHSNKDVLDGITQERVDTWDTGGSSDGGTVDVSGKEDKVNKVTALSYASTDEEYPSAKATVDYVTNKITNVYKHVGSCDSQNIKEKKEYGTEEIGNVYNVFMLDGSATINCSTINTNIQCNISYFDADSDGEDDVCMLFEYDKGIDITFNSGDVVYLPYGSLVYEIPLTLKEYHGYMNGWVVTTSHTFDDGLSVEDALPAGAYCATKIEYSLQLNNGDNVVWTGYKWDKLAGTVDLSNYATKDDLGDIETALDGIIAIQESIIGGESA